MRSGNGGGGLKEVVIKVIGNYSYQTSKCLGEGVYGKVYEGLERETKEKVAIKKIDLETFTNDKYLENAIFSQIYLLKRFNHANIVKFKDVLSSKNSLYIITEFCKNGDLKELMKKKRFKEEEVFEIMKQILCGFNELVREKIIHRDLKPANILINDGVYKIGDFGFAKYVDNFGSQMLKSCVGSPIYMAPQILERGQYTTKCDVWSLGIICYEMLFCQPPWKAKDENELLRSIKTIPIIHILKRSTLSQKANEFLRKTLAYSQEERIGWSDLFSLFVENSPSELSLSDRLPRSQQTIQFPQGSLAMDRPSTQDHRTQERLPSATSQGSLTIMERPSTTLSPQHSNLIKNKSAGQFKETPGIQHVTPTSAVSTVRQCCIYYHYYCVQLFGHYNFVRNNIKCDEGYGRLLYALAMLVKCRSTYCMSLINGKGKARAIEDQLKGMKQEHETYEMVCNDIVSRLEREGKMKKIKEEFAQSMGFNDIITEERNCKLENMVISYGQGVGNVLSEDVKKRGRGGKDYVTMEILESVVDVLALGIGKIKALKEMKEESRMGDQDLKDYVGKVIYKLERITANI